MKKTTTALFLLLTFNFFSFSQVDRDMVILEIGTGTWCQYCPGAAMGADDLIEAGYDVAVVEYHSGDDYQNPYSTSRISYYNITGFPTAYFDGTNPYEGGSQSQSLFPVYSSRVNQRQAVASSFTIDVTGTHECMETFYAAINLEKAASSTSTNLRLHAVATESHIEDFWQGMDEVNYVCRLMVPSQAGTSVSFEGGSTQTVNLQFTLDPSWIPENMEFVVFLQDATTKEILQGFKMDLLDFTPVNQYDATVKSISDMPQATCQGYFEPQVVIRNVGAQPIISLDLTYSVNGENPQVFNWTGNLNYLESDEITLPGISGSINGENEITVTCSNPSDNPDECDGNNIQVAAVPEAQYTGNTVKLFLRTDANPQETTWEIIGPSGDTVYQGGPYSTPSTIIQETFDLPEDDCYSFYIHDAGGDGLLIPGVYLLYYNTNTSISQGMEFGSVAFVEFNTSDPVGIDDLPEPDDLLMYPNPARDKLHVVLNTRKDMPATMELINLAGQVVRTSVQGTLPAGRNEVVIDLEDLGSGMYFYRFTMDHEVRTGKVVVN